MKLFVIALALFALLGLTIFWQTSKTNRLINQTNDTLANEPILIERVQVENSSLMSEKSTTEGSPSEHLETSVQINSQEVSQPKDVLLISVTKAISEYGFDEKDAKCMIDYYGRELLLQRTSEDYNYFAFLMNNDGNTPCEYVEIKSQ